MILLSSILLCFPPLYQFENNYLEMSRDEGVKHPGANHEYTVIFWLQTGTECVLFITVQRDIPGGKTIIKFHPT